MQKISVKLPFKKISGSIIENLAGRVDALAEFQLSYVLENSQNAFDKSNWHDKQQ